MFQEKCYRQNKGWLFGEYDAENCLCPETPNDKICGVEPTKNTERPQTPQDTSQKHAKERKHWWNQHCGRPECTSSPEECSCAMKNENVGKKDSVTMLREKNAGDKKRKSKKEKKKKAKKEKKKKGKKGSSENSSTSSISQTKSCQDKCHKKKIQADNIGSCGSSQSTASSSTSSKASKSSKTSKRSKCSKRSKASKRSKKGGKKEKKPKEDRKSAPEQNPDNKCCCKSKGETTKKVSYCDDNTCEPKLSRSNVLNCKWDVSENQPKCQQSSSRLRKECDSALLIIFELIHYVTTLYTLPCVLTEFLLVNGVSEQMALLPIGLSSVPLIVYILDNLKDNCMLDVVIIGDLIFFGYYSARFSSEFGVATALDFGVSHFILRTRKVKNLSKEVCYSIGIIAFCVLTLITLDINICDCS